MLNYFVRKTGVLLIIIALVYGGNVCKNKLIKAYRYRDLINQIEDIVQKMHVSFSEQNKTSLLSESQVSVDKFFAVELGLLPNKTHTRDVYKTVCVGSGDYNKGAGAGLRCRHLKIAEYEYFVPHYASYNEDIVPDKINLYRGQFWSSWLYTRASVSYAPLLVGFNRLPQDVCEKVISHDWRKLKIDTAIVNKTLYVPYSYDVVYSNGLHVKQYYVRPSGTKGLCDSKNENFVELLFE